MGPGRPIFMLVFLGVVVLFDRLTHRHLSWFESGLAALMLLLSFFSCATAIIFLGSTRLPCSTGALLFVSLYGGQARKYNLWDFVAFPV